MTTPQLITRADELRLLRQQRDKAQKTLALVPTMGNLHAGHLSLVETAKTLADQVMVSIFVNPLQFGPNEDFDAYPRTLDADLARLAEVGCDLVFAPSASTLYPEGQNHQTRVLVPQVSEGLCGSKRPGHFEGVATVVSKLFNLTQPQVACFGEKDYQQLSVIRKLTQDLNFPIQIVGVPTCRDADGLALSSRNQYLSSKERSIAPGLFATLQQTAAALTTGNRQFHHLEEDARAHLAELGFAPDYYEIRALDLTAPKVDASAWVILAAAFLGKTRLIDNLEVRLCDSGRGGQDPSNPV